MAARITLLLLGFVCYSQAGVMTATLTAKALAAFDAYVQEREAGMENDRIRGTRFLWAEDKAERLQQLKSRGFVIEPHHPGPVTDIGDALVHDWVGAVFIPGVTVTKTLAFLQDYDRHKNFYAPEVADSKLLSKDGDQYKAYLKLVKKKVITVTLNTEYDVLYSRLDEGRAASRSYSVKIAEVRKDGTELPRGMDHGFLWRLHSWWRFLDRDGGVYVECETISLSRDVPFGLGPIIRPIIRDLPRESLERTLLGTLKALSSPRQK